MCCCILLILLKFSCLENIVQDDRTFVILSKLHRHSDLVVIFKYTAVLVNSYVSIIHLSCYD